MRRFNSESRLQTETTFGVDPKPSSEANVTTTGNLFYHEDDRSRRRYDDSRRSLRVYSRAPSEPPTPRPRRVTFSRDIVEQFPEPMPRSISSSQLRNLLSGSSVSSSRHPSEQVNAHSAFHQPLAYSNLPTTSTPVRLAISLQIGDYKVWDFLGEVMSRGWADCGTFRLAPAYALYLALRFFQSHTKAYLVQFFARIEANLKQIATNCSSRDELLFWMANASELSYLVDRDPDLRPRAGKLSVEVERVFRRLCTVLLGALRPCSRPMLDTRISDQDGSAELISLLDSTLRAARTSRLNAALTIQISGHMLHTVNAFIFNHLVGVGVSPVPLTTRLGKSLQARLASVHRWAEGMGVELAAECHLDRSRQAANLLAAQKNDVAALGATCYKLNSMQIRRFLSAFEHEDGEIPVDSDVINRIVRLAEKQADLLTKEDGQKITLEEPDELNLPFLIPQDGYTAELLTDVPEGLTQYLMKLEDRRVCHSVSLLDSNEQIRATSVANEHMNMSTSQNGANFQPPPPITRSASQTTLTSIPTTQFGDSFGSNGDDIIRVHLKRGNGGIGLSIVAAQGIGDRKMGIYVKKVVEGTPAAVDGRLCTGDQLLSVNGHSLLGISQEDAAKLMTNSGPEVSFEVRKGAAHRNGIGAWLNGTPTTPSTSGAGPPQYIPPSPAMSSTHAPPSYSNFSSSHGGSQQTVEAPPTYQQRYQQQQAGSTRSSGQPTAPSVRSVPSIPAQHYQQHAQHHQMHQTMTPSAVVEPLQQPQNLVHRHFRSNSASDLHQNDSNASYSQRSATNGAPSNFDKLPAHYRHSSRPTVIQPSRPGAVSPSALRRGAQSPSAISTNGFGGPLYRPSSASNLFAPPRSPNPLHGYSSNSARESNQDIYRASMAFDSPPAAQSSPREDKYQHYSHQADYSSYSASLPQPLNSSSPYQSRPSSMYGYSSQNRPSSTVTAPTYSQQQARANNSPPRVSVANSTTHVSHPTSSSSIHAVSRSQEPAVVRPMDLGMRREYTEERQTTSSGVMRGAVPTAITQALQLQQEKGLPLHPQPMRSAAAFRERGVDADLRQLERTNTALMSYEAVNDELDRLDMKGINMTEEETRRYRELLNVAAEQSRTRRGLSSEAVTHKPVVIHHRPLPVPASSSSASTSLGSRVRTETLIDDVSSSYQTVNGSATRENVSPNSADAHKIHYIDSDFLNINGKRDDVQLIDSPGIVGAHEIYRDPRQRRLNEIQERQQSQVPSSDGASLGFRDKQRLFAAQLGEQGTPKQRAVVSSAQRQIEHDIS
ncbi:unnamed protein product [Caenorhabditis auriculariae]|uniref:Uncharacterized protein n=1 Tax=Caenorhabditis auriculariae TaxID=2777116 RepID=A0A8S1H3N9_9PELO|nr:unnamed protein product [Caenorhabditis auriculariae]